MRPKLDIAPGTWDDARALVDHEVARVVGADPVEASAIRRLLEVHEWDHPPSYDARAARRLGLPGVVAPRSTYLTFALPAYWAPGDAPIGSMVIPPLPFRIVPGNGSMMVATNVDVSFGAPICVGDTLAASYWLRRVIEKDTKVGQGAFLEFEARFTNQRNELVATETTRVLRYEPVAAGPTPPSSTSARPAPGVESASVTTPVPPTCIRLTLQRLVMAAGANRDFAPVHHDPAVATAAGMPAPFANSMFVGTHLERTAVEWAGWACPVERLGFRLLAPAACDAVLIAEGSARSVSTSGGRRSHCELNARTEPGSTTAVGFVDVHHAGADEPISGPGRSGS